MKKLEIEEATLKFRQTPSSVRYAGGPASLRTDSTRLGAEQARCLRAWQGRPPRPRLSS